MSAHLITAGVAFGVFLLTATLALGAGAMVRARDADPLVRWQRRLADRAGLGALQRTVEPVFFRLVVGVAWLLALGALAVALWHLGAAILSD